MSHDRNSGTENPSDGFLYLFSAFEFDGIGSGFFHNAYGRCQSLLGVSLIGTERHIDNNERTFYGTDDRLSVIDHLVESHGQCGNISCHNVRGRIAHQNYVHAGTVDKCRHRVVVSGKHRYFFAAFFHFDKAACSYFAGIFGIS